MDLVTFRGSHLPLGGNVSIQRKKLLTSYLICLGPPDPVLRDMLLTDYHFTSLSGPEHGRSSLSTQWGFGFLFSGSCWCR